MIMLDGLPSMPCRNTPLQQCNLIKNIMTHMWAISTVAYSDPWPICGPLALWLTQIHDPYVGH